MVRLIDKMSEKIELWREEASQFAKANGDKTVDTINVGQLYGGMRGVVSMVTDTSVVPKDKGLIIRGIPIKDLVNITPVQVFYLLLTGELPNEQELHEFAIGLRIRKFVPYYVWEVLRNMPKDSHPMTMLSMAVLSMQRESVFAMKYAKGLHKQDYWRYTLEDALNIVAKLPAIAAAVYRFRFGKGELIQPDPDMNLTADFVHMLGVENNGTEMFNLMRLFLVCHSDHEGGNVSSFSSSVVNSALSDLYYSLSAGFNGLAGPLHGLANQESLLWILELMKKYGGGSPTKEQIEEHVNETLLEGRVVPGYGHAVLRVTDPRFEAFYDFGMSHCPDDPVFKTVQGLYEVVPQVLKGIEKIQNPYPNVDAITGSLLYHYGIKEFSYYTVLFALSRSIGLASQAVMNRAMMAPIIRPKSVTTEWLKGTIK